MGQSYAARWPAQQPASRHCEAANPLTPPSYAIFLIPSQIIITRVRPSWWLPLLEFCWGVLTLFMYLVKDAKQVYAMRAFVSGSDRDCHFRGVESRG